MDDKFFIKLAISKWRKMLALKRMGVVTPSGLPSENVISWAGVNKAYKKLREIRGPGGKLIKREGSALRDLIPTGVKAKSREAVKRSARSGNVGREYGAFSPGFDLPKGTVLHKGGPGFTDIHGGIDALPKEYSVKLKKIINSNKSTLEDLTDAIDGLPTDVRKQFENKSMGSHVGGSKGLDTIQKHGVNPKFLRRQKAVVTLHNHPQTPLDDFFRTSRQDIQSMKKYTSPTSTTRSYYSKANHSKKDIRTIRSNDRMNKRFSDYETSRLLTTNNIAQRVALPSGADIPGFSVSAPGSKHYIASKDLPNSKTYMSVSTPKGVKKYPNSFGVETVLYTNGQKARDLSVFSSQKPKKYQATGFSENIRDLHSKHTPSDGKDMVEWHKQRKLRNRREAVRDRIERSRLRSSPTLPQ
jgi:hypothetical protein